MVNTFYFYQLNGKLHLIVIGVVDSTIVGYPTTLYKVLIKRSVRKRVEKGGKTTQKV